MCYAKVDICSRLVGFTLGDARQVASANGYTIADILITAPPKLGISQYDDTFRVLRVSVVKDKTLEILVCKPL